MQTCKDCIKYQSGRCAKSDDDNEICGNFKLEEKKSKMMDEWTSVKDDLPKKTDEYFVTWEWIKGKRYIGICEYDAETGKWNVEDMEQSKWYKDIKIVAWTNVPDTYEGD